MSNRRRKQRFNPIEYKEELPPWMLPPKKEPKPVKVKPLPSQPEPPPPPPPQPEPEPEIIMEIPEEPVPEEFPIEEERDVYVIESEDASVYVIEDVPEAQTLFKAKDKDKTREFVQKEMTKLCGILDELIELDNHDFVVNFVLDMAATAKRKTWQLKGLLRK